MVNVNYLYNPDAAKTSFERNYFVDKKLGFRIIENGTILPHKNVVIPGIWHFGLGGIVDSNGEYIKESSLGSTIGGPYTPPPEVIRHSSETVIYLGLFYRIWGHDLTDNIRRVWFLKSDTFRRKFKNCPIVYLPYDGGRLTLERQPNVKRLLELLEVDIDRVQAVTQPTQFKRIILADGSFLPPGNPGGSGFTAEYREGIDRVRNFALKNRTPTQIKKLYFFYGRRQIGEERIAKYFWSKGYAIVQPETLTLDQQINLLINAESFASTSGSCAHNALFLRDGTETVIIPRAAGQFNYYQEIINQVHPLNINYADSSLSIFAKKMTTGPYFFIISKQLRELFGDKFDGYEEEDFKNFLQYAKYSLHGSLVLTSDTENYYHEILSDFMEQLKRHEALIKACAMPPGWERFRPLLTYQTHVSYRGWGDGWKSEEQISNPLEQKLDIQAIKINFLNHKIYYSVYFDDAEGWSEEVLAPETAGTVGKRKSIFGVRIRFDEAGARNFDILYRLHTFNDEWTPWAKNGEALYSYGVKLNAIQMKLETKT